MHEAVEQQLGGNNRFRLMFDDRNLYNSLRGGRDATVADYGMEDGDVIRCYIDHVGAVSP